VSTFDFLFQPTLATLALTSKKLALLLLLLLSCLKSQLQKKKEQKLKAGMDKDKHFIQCSPLLYSSSQ